MRMWRGALRHRLFIVHCHRSTEPQRSPVTGERAPNNVNACNYARHLPQALRFREFTANLALAAGTWQEYQAKRHVYQCFYHYLYHADAQMVLATPHSARCSAQRMIFHPFPQSEIDAWVARVAVRCLRPTRAGRKRILVSLHSTDYFGVFLDVGDFGLPQNQLLSRAMAELQADFRRSLAALVPAYQHQIVPYTRSRLHWIQQRWGGPSNRNIWHRSLPRRALRSSIW